MKKVYLGLLLLILLIGVVSASLCKSDDGYYEDCSRIDRDTNYNSDNVIVIDSKDYDGDNYDRCINNCRSRYRHGWLRSHGKDLREKCYDLCQERNRYSTEIESVEKVKDLRNVYRSSFENKIVIIDEKKNYYKDDRSEVVWLDKREYEYERPYFSRNSAIVYVNPYRHDRRDYSNQYNKRNYDKDSSLYSDVFYLGKKRKDVVYLDSNRAGHDYKHGPYLDGSNWRYKKDYVWSNYQDCGCKEWSRGRCQEWECDDNQNNYYYKPHKSRSGGFNWRW